MNTHALIPLESVNATEIFVPQKLDSLLTAIKAEISSIVADVNTPEGRKEIASIAYKIARSKTTIDEAGKALVADWKKKSGEVDAMRKHARDYLDALKDEVRAPLTEWEAEQARIEQEKLEQVRLAQEAEDRRKREEFEKREAEIRAKEEAIARAEAEAKEKAASEQAEKDRMAYEERVRKQADENAKREIEEALKRAEHEAEQAKQYAKETAERAEREKLEAEERARLTAEKAARDKAEAIKMAEERARRESEAKEKSRIAEEARIKAENDRRIADIKHRKDINNNAVSAFVNEGINEETAKKIVILIASGSIPRISINY